MKLYNVRTKVSKYHGCKNVRFTWFRCDRGEQRPYAELIENYDPASDRNYYSEDYIESLFTEEEAHQLEKYLDREHGDAGVTTITAVDLPVPQNIMSVGAIAVGGGDDFYQLCDEPEYSLPFKVWGYFNLVDCELIDGSDVYHPRLWLLSPNGEIRQQTNEEAAAFDPAPF